MKILKIDAEMSPKLINKSFVLSLCCWKIRFRIHTKFWTILYTEKNALIFLEFSCCIKRLKKVSSVASDPEILIDPDPQLKDGLSHGSKYNTVCSIPESEFF